jgi:hypothetical protein
MKFLRHLLGITHPSFVRRFFVHDHWWHH